MKIKFITTFFSIIILLPLTITQAQNNSVNNADPRTLVEMPEQARRFMQQDMIGLLSALNEIMKSLSANDFKTAADIAENHIGKSAMGKHGGTGMGPGRFMTIEMRNIAWGLHEAGSEFAIIAAKGDKAQAYIALNKITGLCVACHNSYRIR